MHAGETTMTNFALRIFIFSVLPLLLAGFVIVFDTSASTRERRIEAFLIFLFALGVAGSGLANFFAHFFLSDLVAESIGWLPGSPFQLEVAFANLTLGVLGLVAVGRRDGFREATVMGVTIFGVGATVVHFLDIFTTGNLAPGNTLQNVSNLLKPALLLAALVTARRAEAAPNAEAGTAEFERWRGPVAQAAGYATACVAMAYGIGFALDYPVLLTLLGTLISFAVVALSLRRSTSH